MNMQVIAEQMRQQLLDAAHTQYQDMVKTINAMFGVESPAVADYSDGVADDAE